MASLASKSRFPAGFKEGICLFGQGFYIKKLPAFRTGSAFKSKCFVESLGGIYFSRHLIMGNFNFLGHCSENFGLLSRKFFGIAGKIDKSLPVLEFLKTIKDEEAANDSVFYRITK